MTKSASRRGFLSLLCVLGLLIAGWLGFGVWFAIASDYSDGVISGTYRLAQNGETSTLVLRPDHTFEQELKRPGTAEHAKGSWRHVASFGGIAFSKELIRVTGQELGANGTAYGEVNKALGLVPVDLGLTDYDI